MSRGDPYTNLSWIDMEMTGLDPATDVVLEIATIVTDKDLQVLAEGPVIAIGQPKDVLDAMDEWNTRTHNESGLVSRCIGSHDTAASAEQKTLEFLGEYLAEGESPLCGNSVHQDRRFLRKYMPRMDAFHSYRIVDVTSFREVIDRWYPELGPYEKAGTHKALDDIRESIGELRFYKDSVFKPEL